MKTIVLLARGPRFQCALLIIAGVLEVGCASSPRVSNGSAGKASSPSIGSSEEWTVFTGSAGNRYSSLDQIGKSNIRDVDVLGRYQLPETMSFQAGPIVIDGTMYFTTTTNTYAIDARTAALRWSQPYKPVSMGLGTPVRGLAFANGRLYRGTSDARLLALDAATGKEIWNVAGADAKKGEYFTAAPIIWKNKLFIGNSGSDIGVIGHKMAFDISDGHRLWSFDNVPSSGPAAATWPSDPNKLKAGGGMYSTFALDTETGTLYIPTHEDGEWSGLRGNPGFALTAAWRVI